MEGNSWCLDTDKLCATMSKLCGLLTGFCSSLFSILGSVEHHISGFVLIFFTLNIS